MKNIYKIILILLFTNIGFSQNSKTIHDKDRLQVSYNLLQIGSSANPITGTNFTKYKLILTVNNTSSKYWNCSHGQTISSKMLNGNTLNSSDERYMRNGGFSTIDHFSIEDNCPDYPRQGSAAAPHQVICPNSSQIGQSTFLHPTDLVGNPEITWTIGTYFEMVDDGIVRNNKVKQTNSFANSNNTTSANNQGNLSYYALLNKFNNLYNEANNSNNLKWRNVVRGYFNITYNKTNDSQTTQELNQNINTLENIKKNFMKKMQNTTTSSCGVAK